MHVYAVEHGARKARLVANPLLIPAGALVRGVAVIAARAGIHGGHQHTRSGKAHTVRSTRNGGHAALKGLAQGLKGRFAKFGQLVQKQHTPVCKTHLAGARVSAAAYQRHIGNSVVRRTKRAHAHKPSLWRKLARNAVYLGNFKRFLKIQRRQDGGQALGQHGFATAGRADKQHIVAARSRHFQRTLGGLLPLNLGIILTVGRGGKGFGFRLAQGLKRVCARQKGSATPKPLWRKNFEPAHYRSFGPVARRNHQPGGPLLTRQQGQWQHAAYRAQCAIERQLARKIHAL